MVTEVHQSLGDVQGLDAVLALLPARSEDALVHTYLIIGNIEEIL